MTFMIDCFRRAAVIGLCVSASQFSYADNTATKPNNPSASAPRTLAEAAAQNSSATAGRTDIVARVDSPRVTNILPWQEQPLSTPKNPLTISALDGSLNPTDRDRLAYETQYSRLLSQPVATTQSNRP